MSLIKEILAQKQARFEVYKDDKALERIIAALTKDLQSVSDAATKKAIKNAIDSISQIDATTFKSKDIDQLVNLFERDLGTDGIAATNYQSVIATSKMAVELGKKELENAIERKIVFADKDLDAMRLIEKTNPYWVGESWNSHSKKRINQALLPYLQTEISKPELVNQLASSFAKEINQPSKYWNTLADHIAGKSREMGRILGYERAGIEYVQVRAQMDQRTSLICRGLNGRIIAVSKMRAQMDNYLKASEERNFAAAKRSWAMHKNESKFNQTPTRKLGSDTASPPYHFRCRTITVAYFKNANASGVKERIYDREQLNKEEVREIINRAKTASWASGSRGDVAYKKHFSKHSSSLGLASQADYNNSAIDLIRKGNRDLHLSIRQGKLNGVFARAQKDNDGNSGFLITTLDLEANKITSHHWRPTLGYMNDDVSNVLQTKSRGITKWLG